MTMGFFIWRTPLSAKLFSSRDLNFKRKIEWFESKKIEISIVALAEFYQLE